MHSKYATNTVVIQYDASQMNMQKFLYSLQHSFFANRAQTKQLVFAKKEFIQMSLPTDDIQAADAIVKQLRAQPGVISVEYDQLRRITVTPNDPHLSSQWHLLEANAGGISARQAWDVTRGSRDVVIAIVDTGVDLDHPDLAANIWVNSDEIPNNAIDDDKNGYIDDVHGYDFANEHSDPNPNPDGKDNDGYGGADTGIVHGTHVAGIAAAVGNNGVGGSGVAWEASIMAVQVLDDEGIGSDSDIAEGILYAVDNGAHIVHMSLGGYGSTNILYESIQYALDHGVLVVAAAGNDGVNIDDNPFYPACYDGVLGVASTDSDNTASVFSNFGTSCVRVAAPGKSIQSTLYANDPAHNFTKEYGVLSGTSMAAPAVSGVAALLLSENPGLTRAELMDLLSLTADDVNLAPVYGSGRLNARAALSQAHIAQYPSEPTAIRAYSNARKKQEYQKGKRYTDTQPFFLWSEPNIEDIVGYYVYFGTNKNAHPEEEGSFQVERTYSPKSITGNSTAYYLRVVTKNSAGLTSASPAIFRYIVDTKIKQPKKVKVRVISNGVKIQWKKVKKDHVKQYVVLRARVFKNKNQLEFRKIATVRKSKYSYIDTSMQVGKTYQYRIQVIDDLGNKTSSVTQRIFIPKGTVFQLKTQNNTGTLWADNASVAHGW
ncbi:MAG TPA: S8 family serine peptidase [Patescibacteria group bacterium]|nr:S8 family serine peptidase [Patescibacteria group bacterium]